jgi:hypothetical protein
MSGLLLFFGALPWVFVVGGFVDLIAGAPVEILDHHGHAAPGLLLLVPCYIFNVYLLFRIGRWLDARIT